MKKLLLNMGLFASLIASGGNVLCKKVTLIKWDELKPATIKSPDVPNLMADNKELKTIDVTVGSKIQFEKLGKSSNISFLTPNIYFLTFDDNYFSGKKNYSPKESIELIAIKPNKSPVKILIQPYIHAWNSIDPQPHYAIKVNIIGTPLDYEENIIDTSKDKIIQIQQRVQRTVPLRLIDLKPGKNPAKQVEFAIGDTLAIETGNQFDKRRIEIPTILADETTGDKTTISLKAISAGEGKIRIKPDPRIYTFIPVPDIIIPVKVTE